MAYFMLLFIGIGKAMKTNYLIEYFLHPKLKESPDTFWKAKIMISGLMLLALVGSFLLMYAAIEEIEELYVIIIPIICVPFLLMAFKKTGALVLFGNITTAVYAFSISPLPSTTGLIYSDDIIWLILAPIMAFTLTNLRSGFFWTMFVASVHCFYFYQSFNTSEQIAPLDHWTPAFYYLSITGLEHKTNQLRNVEKTLRHSNHELEQFAYVVSHDLKAPLRGINSFSTLLDRHLAKKYDLDNTTQEYLQFIKDGTVNMNQLIEDIMNYSKAGSNKEGQEESVDMEIIQTLIDHNLRHQMIETNTQLFWKNIPKTVDLPKVQMLQLVQNLISNAIKYRKPDVAPIITVTGFEQEICWKFTIEDNGTGISKENIQKVFDLFIKLQGTNQEGSGVGLATCKKIVVHNGGEMWLESQLGVGSTFHFTILKNKYKLENNKEKASEKSIALTEAYPEVSTSTV